MFILIISDKACSFSKEAKRAGLDKFIQKVQDTYFEYNSMQWLPGTSLEDHIVKMKTRLAYKGYVSLYPLIINSFVLLYFAHKIILVIW